jgi:hypothetical protein
MMRDEKDACTIRVLQNKEGLSLLSEAGRTAEHARARIGTLPSLEAKESLDTIRVRCNKTQAATGDEQDAIAIEAGARWQLDASILTGENEALARLVLPEKFADDFREHPLHPALLDIALSYYIALVPGATTMLPWRYEKLSVTRPCKGRFSATSASKSTAKRPSSWTSVSWMHPAGLSSKWKAARSSVPTTTRARQRTPRCRIPSP